jgi:hypothetical protein
MLTSFLFMSSSAITHRGESEKLPYFSGTCHIRRPFPSWHCSSSFALCAFLVEGMSLTLFFHLPFFGLRPLANKALFLLLDDLMALV